MQKALASHLYSYFVTNQSYYAEQQDDGSYRKKPGMVTPEFLVQNLNKGGSIAIYQKNTDYSIKWICYDFDILKKNLNSEAYPLACKELYKAVNEFCDSLENLGIPFLLEYSGNRGFHVWITFEERIQFKVGYDIQQAILDKVNLRSNLEYITIDLFPASGNPTAGVGVGVKIPASKHRKSGMYSLLVSNVDEIESNRVTSITNEIIENQVKILESHKSTTKLKVETALGVFFDLSQDEASHPPRIRTITVVNKGFTLKELIEHWQKHKPLKVLADKVQAEQNLNNDERKLLVGILANVTCKNNPNFSIDILHSIFKKTPNYKYETSRNAINALSSFYFPSQEQIEKTLSARFDSALDTNVLLPACIPRYVNHIDATLDICAKDVDIVRMAEINYLLINDEVQIRSIVNEMMCTDRDELVQIVYNVISNNYKTEFYSHERLEGEKTRTLTSLKAIERVSASSILKQLIYLLDYEPNPNSFGYRPNKGFKDCHIFKPWLFLWIEFVSNITSALKDEHNSSYYIVKTDVEKFYDRIPHDNLKRLLLGGVNPRIDSKITALQDSAAKKYETFIEALIRITQNITGSSVGLPQGPAYARFLAELYLDNVDTWLSDQIDKGNLFLYQRYVDDIFFIAPTKEIANQILTSLQTQLELLGLSINTKKTTIAKVGDFSKDFDAYRSQAKYAVDAVSKNFADATATQKDMAIDEFLKLVQSDSCSDDLAFIYSHLTGVSVLDQWKRDKVVPTVEGGIGRGTVYKHLFNFVLEDTKGGELLAQISKLTPLQSEVITASFIHAFENINQDAEYLKSLVAQIEPKLDCTQVVKEHLAYLFVTVSIDIDINKIEPEIFLHILANLNNSENMTITSKLVDYLNTALNGIESLQYFTRVLYSLCVSDSLHKTDLDKLSSIFYAKLAADYNNDVLSIGGTLSINSYTTTNKFYYLLCLLSLSDKNDSTDLLKAMWQFCTHLFNTFGFDRSLKISSNWFNKIDDVDIHEVKAQLVVTSIVDGSLFRGVEDKCKVFERFHNLVLIYITFHKSDILIADIDLVLAQLRDKGVFYEWLGERATTRIFPYRNKMWFERNLIENGMIMLRKDDCVLIRRQTEDFHPNSKPTNEYNGYSEVIHDYHPEELKSLKEILGAKNAKEIFDYLDRIMASSVNQLPNFFLNERLVFEDSLNPFTDELKVCNSLIFENHNEHVESYANDALSFAKCYFTFLANESKWKFCKYFCEKYLNNLEDMDFAKLFKSIIVQMNDFDSIEDVFSLDVIMASAIYVSFEDYDHLQKIDKFVSQYHYINRDASDRHIYGVSVGSKPIDDDPLVFLDSVELALGAIRSQVYNTLTFYLDKDIANYRISIEKIVDKIDDVSVELSHFKKAIVKISHTKETVNVNGVDYKFADVYLLHVVIGDVQQFDPRYSTVLNSGEHIYYYKIKTKIYLIVIQPSITKIYQSLLSRYEFIASKDQDTSFPVPPIDKQDIVKLDGFFPAVNVISIHRNFSKEEAESTLLKWLQFLPRVYHRCFVSLISAHVVMTNEELDQFINAVNDLKESSNSFIIKRIGDFNGTHRVLYRDNSIGRNVDSFSPTNITDGAKNATIVTDNVITGSQIIDAVKFYVTGTTKQTNANYFEYNLNVANKIKELRHINICTILYTKQAIQNIDAVFKEVLNPDVTVNVINGRDIGGDAFFGPTTKIGGVDKNEIKSILMNEDLMRRLHNILCLKVRRKIKVSYSEAEIDSTNLVARYQSLPKKCFAFLHAGLKHDINCHPLIRIFESCEY